MYKGIEQRSKYPSVLPLLLVTAHRNLVKTARLTSLQRTRDTTDFLPLRGQVILATLASSMRLFCSALRVLFTISLSFSPSLPKYFLHSVCTTNSGNNRQNRDSLLINISLKRNRQIRTLQPCFSFQRGRQRVASSSDSVRTFGKYSKTMSIIAASLYSFQASAFFIIWSASALAFASIANASASPFKRRLSASASASRITRLRWASANFSNLKKTTTYSFALNVQIKLVD